MKNVVAKISPLPAILGMENHQLKVELKLSTSENFLYIPARRFQFQGLPFLNLLNTPNLKRKLSNINVLKVFTQKSL